MNTANTFRSAMVLLALFGAFSVVAAETFFDDFTAAAVDSDKWYTAQKNWGGKVLDADGNPTGEDYNGGVMAQNVYVRDGLLVCEAHGNEYLGDLLGVNKDLSSSRCLRLRVSSELIAKIDAAKVCRFGTAARQLRSLRAQPPLSSSNIFSTSQNPCAKGNKIPLWMLELLY